MLNAYAGWEQEQDPGVFSEANHCLEDISCKNKFHCVVAYQVLHHFSSFRINCLFFRTWRLLSTIVIVLHCSIYTC